MRAKIGVWLMIGTAAFGQVAEMTSLNDSLVNWSYNQYNNNRDNHSSQLAGDDGSENSNETNETNDEQPFSLRNPDLRKNLVDEDKNETINQSKENTAITDRGTSRLEIDDENLKEALIASGTFGTSEWSINESGVLYIGRGSLGRWAYNSNPWRIYADRIIKIVIDRQVVAHEDSSYLFSGLNQVTEFVGLENLDTSQVSDMSYMFSHMNRLTTINLRHLDTNNVVKMSRMFLNVSSLKEIDVSNFNTGKVVNMLGMFTNMTSLTNLDLSNFTTRNVAFFQEMFLGMVNLITLNLSHFDTSRGNSMSRTFENLPSLKKIQLGAGFRFLRNAQFPEAPANLDFTGRWINVGTGTEDSPNGQNSWTASEFLLNFEGKRDADTYVWEPKKSGMVTVNYLNMDDERLSEPTILNGKVGQTYISEAKEIAGWEVISKPTNAEGIFKEEPQEVIYQYDRKKASPVTVYYQDKEGNELAEPTILNGKVGQTYISEAKEIAGWEVISKPTNAEGIFAEESQEVIYQYDRKKASPVIVYYQDKEGNELAESAILNGKVGQSYISEAKEIAGWEVISKPTNAEGIFKEEPQEVIYQYDRKAVSDGKIDSDKEPNSIKKLPNTSESANNKLAVIGIGSLFVCGLAMIYSYRKKE
ncbi:MucBP domain-containing protein [Enterococcus gallinarum]|uniref:MucBP domain-containing protein n=1 Tax=Enterococcus gallinarum TaxID=1353 RepID=UPI0012E20F22|nr:MucBP domain-containing protein [Enterococcus gallinarum]MUO32384.1 BspA family leucine-rich repeat surface protein [Enterococcus gallinarum]